eukprot:CAMPEP_0182852580 /NCGR_PEP_ID=MMETSP0034_2-20130328/239_1 /TAXON_ID=156128 /ORGANISM="Nephroselmis pyriformis, Strain CCMP717" /LENGTH=101 /DNA_ID=CAMNT_0024983297 /DNA_START=90 /DNA_END=391 /DNA_ORIENTATION=+
MTLTGTPAPPSQLSSLRMRLRRADVRGESVSSSHPSVAPASEEAVPPIASTRAEHGRAGAQVAWVQVSRPRQPAKAGREGRSLASTARPSARRAPRRVPSG